jgi:hypothetical protein
VNAHGQPDSIGLVQGELFAGDQGLGASWIYGVIEAGDLKLDLNLHMLWRGDDEIHLSPKEFDLLAFARCARRLKRIPPIPNTP